MRTVRSHADAAPQASGSQLALAALSLAGAMLLLAPAARAQSASPIAGAAPRALQVTPYAGWLMTGNLVDGPLGTSLGSAASPLYGAQLGVTLAPGLTLIGNVAHASGDLEVGVPLLGGIDVGRTRAFLADGGLQLALPTPRTGGIAFVPFVQAGVGAIRWDIDLGDGMLQTKATNFAGNVGAGVDLPFGEGFGVRLMAKDYIGKFDFAEAASLDVDTKLTHNWALSAGVRLSF